MEIQVLRIPIIGLVQMANCVKQGLIWVHIIGGGINARGSNKIKLSHIVQLLQQI